MLRAFSILTALTLVVLGFVCLNNPIEARAYDTNPMFIYTGSVGIGFTNPDFIAPIVSIVSPANGSTVWGIVNIFANATDNVGVTKMEIYTDGSVLGVGSSAPYSIFWDTTNYANNTSHNILAKAYDAAGNVGSSSAVLVTVKDITPPSVTITNPINGSLVKTNSKLTISANAADVSGISKVEFYVNGLLKCTKTVSPYSCKGTVPSKSGVKYTIQAKAYDTASNSATNTVTVTSQ